MTSPPFPPPTSNFSPFTGPPPLIGHQPPPSMGAPYPPPILYWPYPSPPISPPHQPPALLIMQGTPPPMAPPPPVDMCNLIHSVSEVYATLQLHYYNHTLLYRVFRTVARRRLVLTKDAWRPKIAVFLSAGRRSPPTPPKLRFPSCPVGPCEKTYSRTGPRAAAYFPVISQFTRRQTIASRCRFLRPTDFSNFHHVRSNRSKGIRNCLVIFFFFYFRSTRTQMF